MDISQLKSFVVVAEAGSYIRASDLLQIPQPTLSRQVRALEVELRASLFHRHGRGVLLTDRGKRFIEYARSILLTVDTALLSVREDEAEYSGQLVIGLTPSISRLVIPSLARQLKERFPRAAISLTEGLSGALYERVLLGQLNFAVLLSPASSPNLDIRPLATEDFYLVGPQSDRDPAASISVQEIAALPLILPHSNQWTRPALESAAARLGLRLNIVLEVDSTFSTLELIHQGIGYSIMPGSMRRLPRIHDLSWQKISNMEATVSIITPSRQPRNRLIEDSISEVTNTIVAVFREEKSTSIVSPII
ncbi:LysR family transcriptional regulator [Comamonas sp. Y33R10-2]|uniref:LysR family transcriptional regulator n=1 Tax=Comamonas sp. Y33R10-2 TaxID=2853257 RepID=UPI001C5CC1FB|nr:LysR substrate-binding domain-containing protein [Comamonas sp. Y33R10-2]QXZ08207.1 LysR family transcriptional regulator [Comamonas sp. Y33R10-2]